MKIDTIADTDITTDLVLSVAEPHEACLSMRREGDDIILRTSAGKDRGVEARLPIEHIGKLVGTLVEMAFAPRKSDEGVGA